MNYKIDITAQAKSDLRSIYEYIAFELLAPENAARQLDRLEESIMGLNHLPLRFREYDTETWKSRGMRIMPVDNFVVLYTPNKETGIVTINRVMYGGRDIDKNILHHDFTHSTRK